jgi:hypothetical protein
VTSKLSWRSTFPLIELAHSNSDETDLVVYISIYTLWKKRIENSGFLSHFSRVRINNNMNNSDFYTTLFETARSLGIADSQYAFSKLCGRKQSWFSSAKSVNRPISMNALTTLAVKLDHLPADRIPRGNRNKIKTFQKAIWRLVETQATMH